MRIVCFCGKEFTTYPSRVKNGKGKFCSKICYTNAQSKYIPWNKGKKGLQEAWNKGKETSLDIRLKLSLSHKGKDTWNKNVFDLDTYYGLHNWVKRCRGKASKCEFCGGTSHISWANKSNTYKKDLNDWIQLCKKCHYHYDKSYFGVVRRIYG